MKKVGFHIDQLGLRGVEVSTYDYAFYNEELLQNRSYIISSANGDLSGYEKFSNRFEVFLYEDFSEVYKFVEKKGIDTVYYQKAGNYDGKVVPGIRNAVHTVFQYNQPHGEVYAYVSKWLSEKMSSGNHPFVPLMIDILKHDHDENYRDFLNIPKDSPVLGYYGGSDSFNIDFAKKAVIDAATKNENMYFLFMNVNPFCDIKNVIYLNGTTDVEKKIGFINTCDACLHARNGGESFGLTVGEFSIKNKPVITTSYCTVALNDLAHLDMLGEKAIIYQDYNSLISIIENVIDIKRSREDWNAYREYSSKNVMEKFKQVFL